MRAGRRGEGGSASVLVLTMAGVLLVVTVGLVLCAGLVSAHRTAQSAADLAALAGAGAVADHGDGCAAAASVAEANGATITSCDVTGRVVHLTVSVDGPRWGGSAARLRGEARAGPA